MHLHGITNRLPFIGFALITLWAVIPYARGRTTPSALEAGPSPSNVAYGRILTMRPIAIVDPPGGEARNSPANGPSNVAGATGSSYGAPISVWTALERAVLRNAANGRLRSVDVGSSSDEFIVRQQDGHVISVVQENREHFVLGERVLVIRSKHVHLAKAP